MPKVLCSIPNKNNTQTNMQPGMSAHAHGLSTWKVGTEEPRA